MRRLLLVLLTSCAATSRVDPGIFKVDRFALVGFHGATQVAINRDALVAPSERENQFGGPAIAQSFEPFRERLAAILKSPLPSPARVKEAPAYADLPLTLDGVPQSSPPGLRPLGLQREALHPLGALAIELEVDTVVAIEARWRLQLGETERQAEVELSLLMVGRDGHLLWKESYPATSPLDAPGATATLLERLSLNETAVQHALFRALMSCLDQFEARWRERAAAAAPALAQP